MTAIHADRIHATRIQADRISARRIGEGDASSWSLQWNGVNAYAVHSAWSMSGYGDRIYFSFAANAPGSGIQYIFTTSSWEGLRVLNTTAVLDYSYKRVGDSAARTVAGPTIVAGAEYSGYIEVLPTRTVMVVNGVEYENATNAALIPQSGTTNIARRPDNTGHFNGTIRYLKYTNATTLQAVNGVKSDGVNLTASLPAITLTSATISFYLKYKSGNQTILTGSVPILTVASNLFVAGANVSAVTVDGVASAGVTLVDGQHYSVVVTVNGGTLTTVGLMASGGIVGELTVIAGGSTYVYDLAGNDGSVIPNTDPTTGSGFNGTWQNYDSGTDQTALPQLSRHYKIDDGPLSSVLQDTLGSGSTDATLYNVDPEDWTR